MLLFPLLGINQPKFITDVHIFITLDTLVYNLLEVPLVNGDLYACKSGNRSATLSSNLSPPLGLERSPMYLWPRVPFHNYPSGIPRSPPAVTARMGQGGYQIPFLKPSQDHVLYGIIPCPTQPPKTHSPCKCTCGDGSSTETLRVKSLGGCQDHKLLRFLTSASNLAEVDFSPLAVLGTAIPRIGLYVHTNILPSTVTLARLLSSLMDYDGIMRSIKEGKLVIHSEKTAPDYVEGRYYVLR